MRNTNIRTTLEWLIQLTLGRDSIDFTELILLYFVWNQILGLFFVSDPIKLHPYIYAIFSGPKFWYIVEDNFIFPTGLLIESLNSIVIAGHVNDHGSALLRIQGLKSLLDGAIEKDKEAKAETVKKFAPFQVQNYVVKRINILEV